MEHTSVGRWVKSDVALEIYADIRQISSGEAAKEIQALMADGEVKARGLKPNDAAFDVFEMELDDEEEIKDRWSTEQSPRIVNHDVFRRAKIDWDDGDVFVRGARHVADLELDVFSIRDWISYFSAQSGKKGGAVPKYTDMHFAVTLAQYLIETKGNLPKTQEGLISALQERWVMPSEAEPTSWGPGRTWMQERVAQLYKGMSSLKKESR